MPPSPWIGSTSTAALCGVTALRSSFMLPKATWSKPPDAGPKPSRYLGLPAADRVVIVRP
jgi:hypothetical protein